MDGRKARFQATTLEPMAMHKFRMQSMEVKREESESVGRAQQPSRWSLCLKGLLKRAFLQFGMVHHFFRINFKGDAICLRLNYNYKEKLT